MTDTPKISRRAALAAGAAAPIAAALGGRPALAAADMLGATSQTFSRFTLGNFEVTTLLGGTRSVENPQSIFGMNVDAATFAQVSEENFIPSDKTQFFFTPTIVNTGSELILFDTGFAPAGIRGQVEAAGYSADQVDTVVITHMHGDHISGLIDESGPAFPGAKLITGALEDNHWSGTESEGYANKIRPLRDQFTFIDDGGSVASGVTAMGAFGHTPGHMTYMIESGGEQVLLCADLANHYVWSLGYPDWEVRFDMDKAAAAATRRRVLGMLAAERIPFIGYHMPFPALGYVAPRDDGFTYVPASYQAML
ncbi:MAG: MBL fold metallo-hydrolase [Pseudomonadota bacterium]